MMKRYLVPALLGIVLMGAGCEPAAKVAQPLQAPVPAPSQPASTAKPTPSAAEKPAQTPLPEQKPEASQPATQASTMVLRPADIDASWRVYTNNALRFQFMWPSRGRYAPEWSVEVYANTDATVKDGCFVFEGETRVPTTASAKDVVFCHTQSSSAQDGQYYVLDAYATVIGKKVAVIRFSKHLANATTLPNDIAFDADEYQTLLNSIVGTFEMKP